MNLASHNVKIAGNGDIQHSHAEYKDQSASSAMVFTKPSTINNFFSVARPTSKLIH